MQTLFRKQLQETRRARMPGFIIKIRTLCSVHCACGSACVLDTLYISVYLGIYVTHSLTKMLVYSCVGLL